MLLARIPPTRSRATPSRSRGGFTLLEVMFASAVLAIAISGAAGAMLSATQLDRVNRERALALQSARRMVERSQDVEFEDLFAAYNSVANDDPPDLVAAGTVPGASFACEGLTAQSADPDGVTGQVFFPTVMNGGVEELREDVVDPQLGMPMDLNMDGVIDGLNHAGDYRLLPVRVRLSWRGVSGDRSADLVTIISRR